MPHPNDLSWRIESLRFTLFLEELSADAGAGWWEQLVGAPPEETTSKRASGDTIDHGPYNDARLWLNRNSVAKRIDWILYNTQPPDGAFPGLSPIDNWLGRFNELMTRWLERCPAVVLRVGFGATFVAPVADAREGYGVLREALPMIQFDEEWSDFTFQVNKRQPLNAFAGTQLEGTKANCLSKWNSVQLALFQVTPASPQTMTLHAARIELDLNTIQENTVPVPSETVRSIMLELGQLAVRYTKEGFLS